VDQAQLVNTLVNVATNILTGQQGGLGGAGQGQGGILGSTPRAQQSGGYPNQAGYGMGVGGVGNGSQSRVWAGQGQEEERWPSSTEAGRMRGSHTGGGKMTAKDFNEKNYRPKIKVEGLPPNYFNGDFEHLSSKHFSCVNCDKRNMWDAESFVKHLRGQKHVNKIEELIKEDQAAVAALRAQMKAKAGKVTGPSKKCAMCDIEVAGKGTDAMNSHRRTTEHQTLKRFIHPHCDYCRADFEDRTDWHYHRLSAEHLTNSEHKHNSKDGVVTSRELQDICIKLGGDKNSLFKSLKDGGNAKKSKGDPEVMIIKENKKKAAEIEGVDAVLKDVDLDNSDIPGAEFVKPVQGFFCQLCKKFFAPGKDVVKTHCSSAPHTANMKAGGKRGSGIANGGPAAKKSK